LEQKLRADIRSNLAHWTKFALRNQFMHPAQHHIVMLNALERLSRGDTRRLMLLLPPGTAKSTYASLLFPAWWMARHPASAVIGASHTAGLANHFCSKVLRLLIEHGTRLGVALAKEGRAPGQFRLKSGGEYFGIGVRGAVTGRRADLALVDDPIACFREAESRRSRDQLWNWFRAELMTRLKPNARLAVIMNRWHWDDLAGRLMDQEPWEVLRLPAIAEPNDALRRAPGEALWPEWEDCAAISKKRIGVGEYSFAAMFQQSPMMDTCRLFKTDCLKVTNDEPRGISVRGWDLAAIGDTSRDPDWTAGVKLVRQDDGNFAIADVRRVRLDAHKLPAFIRSVAQEDGTEVVIGLARDPGQAGVYQAAMLTRALDGFRVTVGPETGTKYLRAGPIASQISEGNVQIHRADWNSDFVEELALFPDGPKDDQVDALSRAFTVLTNMPQPAHFRHTQFFAR
jgi:predicted phage terminase large subunit-like protein